MKNEFNTKSIFDEFTEILTSSMISEDRRSRGEIMRTLTETPTGMIIPWVRMKQMAAILKNDEKMETMLSEYIYDEACQ